MLKKNKTRLFRHFITCVNIIACSVPLIVLCFNVLHDFFPKYLTSLGMQHHGSNDDFSEDLSLLSENSQLRDFNTNALSTLDTLGYLDYNDTTTITKNVAQTNEVNSNTDLILGNYYRLNMKNSDNESIIDYLTFYMELPCTYFYIENYINLSDSEFIEPYTFNRNNARFSAIYIDLESEYYLFTPFNEANLYFDFNKNDYFIVEITQEFLDYAINQYTFNFFEECPSEYLPITYTEETNDVTSFDDWLTATNGKQLSYIMDNNVNEDSLFLKINFLSLFGIDVTNVNNSVATYLFINYYINYFITITLILFLPQLIFIFIDWVRELLYKFTDVEDRT